MDPRGSARRPHLDHRHLVPGERARLVGADERGGAERLDRIEPADERLRRAMRCAPIARDRVTVGRRPSGTSATTTPIANRNPSLGAIPTNNATPKNEAPTRRAIVEIARPLGAARG